MIRIFNRNRNTIGQLMVALIFLGTFGFLFMFDGFAAKSEAKSCCGGAPAVTTFAADSSGDFGSDIPMDAESSGGCCGDQDKPIPSSSNNNGDGGGDGGDGCTCLGTDCGSCGNGKCDGGSKPGCPDNSSCSGTDSCSCDGSICNNSSKCSGSC